uniref:Uncharacterized protein n=1 Tax=Leptospira santarosai serovar Arenal str. MAVJ 401 TaxID=1049976 RepID=M6K2T5_9LEPT|nr:hypothetical protein LEP1GSC063_4321 [Leptospira santarosai serovar Arenal str. MAVJ 401]
MDRSSLLCKEPTLSLRGFWLSRSLWIAHLCFAKNQRFRFAAFGYLALYGSLDKKKLFGMIVNKILEKIENTRGPI